MSGDNEEIMFEVGVVEHPQVKSRLDSLAKSVLDAQSKMTMGIDRLSAAATAASSNIGSVAKQMKDFSASAVMNYDDLRGAIGRIHAIANKKAQMVVEVMVKADEKDAAQRMAKEFEVVGKQGVDVQMNMPANIANVFKGLGDAASEEASRVSSKLQSAVDGLPNSVAGVTHKVKAEYEKRVQIQANAYAQMAADLDAANAKQGEASEKMNANVMKGVRSVLAGAKGFAELGVAGKESSEAMLSGLVAIQGVADAVEGGIGILEAFNSGWKLVRQSQDAVSSASSIQKAMMGGQFAQLKGYQAQLAQEALAANTATAANNRLNESRSVAGGAVGSATQATGGIAGKLAGIGAKVGGAITSGTGLSMATTVAGVGVGVMGTIAAAGAALASVAIAGKVLSESLSGTAMKQDSLTMGIANLEAGLGASAIQMTGFQDSLKNAGGFLGAFASLASSNVALAKAEANFRKSQMEKEQSRKLTNLENKYGGERDQADFARNSSVARNNASINKNDGAALAETFSQSKASDKLAGLQKVIENYKSGESNDLKAYSQAVAQSNHLQADILNSISTQQNYLDQSFNDKLSAEAGIQSQALEKLAKYQKQVAAGEGTGAKDAEAYAEAVKQVLFYEDTILSSKEKQRGLESEMAKTRVDSQAKVQDSLKKQLDLQTSSMDKLVSGYRSAATNFSKLGEIEKHQVQLDLAKARKVGGANLSDEERDRLSQVGGDEVNRYVNDGNLAEAKRYGFDQSFGSGFDGERKKIENEQRNINAQLEASYKVAVNLKFDSKSVEDMMVNSMNKVVDERTGTIMDNVAHRMRIERSQITSEQDSKRRQELGLAKANREAGN